MGRTDCEETTANDGHDPVHTSASGPAEPEQAQRDEEGADEGGGETVLGLDLAVLVELRFHVFMDVPEEGRL